MEYNFQTIEKKWQKKWEEKKAFEAKNKGKKFYALHMWPYPSGSGLHMGHAFNYTITDVLVRMKRMQGFNVLFPVGYDSLGLPAENAAIKEGVHPKKYTEKAISNFMKQERGLGLSYDWRTLSMAHDPEYYKWDQWIFLQLFKKGLAYRKKAPVNYCKKCDSVLANEQVVGGCCWRHEDTQVETKELEQWFFKTTKYADELYEGIDKLDGWPNRIKVMQKNWIGKKEWIDIGYKIEGTNEEVVVSTTRPDTNFGATFVVMAPEHRLLDKKHGLVPEKYRKKVDEYLALAKKKTEQERLEEGTKKTGVFTGLYCINQLTGRKMPIWVTDFVMTSVGTGAVVGVPGHDRRDFEFAKEFDLPVIRVVMGSDGDKTEIKKIEQVQDEEGTMVNSDFLNGMDLSNAMKKIMDYLEEKKLGKRAIRFRLKDWLVSRQRYWGTPIPVVYCEKCGIVPVPEKELPVKLPERVKFGKGNPLLTDEKWISVKCPKCDGNARRETDTMDTFVNSSWYFLRYLDAKNKKQIFDPKKVKSWMPIDQYIGGAEHACMHLIYFRFYTKFLRDIGLLDFDEPAKKLFNQGMLHGHDGYVMSKSRGNVVLPETISKKYGIDTARLFLMSIATPDKDIQWSDSGIEGSFRFVRKVMEYFNGLKTGKADKKTESKLNKTVKEFTEDIENFRYNLAIIKLRVFFESLPEKTGREVLESFLKLFSVFCPHLSEDLWSRAGGKGFISLSSWPKVDEKKINLRFDKEEEAFENLVRDLNNVKKFVSDCRKAFVYVIPNEKDFYVGRLKDIEKRTNLRVEVFAVNDKDKHDPENKSKKAKPGKPGIYLE